MPPARLTASSTRRRLFTGFFASPAGPGGDRFTAPGGHISIVSYSQKQKDARKFLEWLSRDDIQQKWADLGGYTADAEFGIAEIPQRYSLQ
jgi:multiple sugar transport system substrate-binding protein